MDCTWKRGWSSCNLSVDAYTAGDTRGGIALALIHDIYAIERKAKDAHLDADARLMMRQSEPVPIVQRLKKWIEEVAGQAPPKDTLG